MEGVDGGGGWRGWMERVDGGGGWRRWMEGVDGGGAEPSKGRCTTHPHTHTQNLGMLSSYQHIAA